MKAISTDTTHVSCRSMRRGGMTAARKARIPEDVVYLQSWHSDGQKRAGRAYIADHSIEDLYATTALDGGP